MDIEAKLISSLSETKKERKKNNKLKEELSKTKENIQGSNPKETKKVFMDLKVKWEEANLVRKLKWGTSKFKGKIPFKCFKCGRIGHFASKSPYGKISDNDEEEEEPPKNKK